MSCEITHQSFNDYLSDNDEAIKETTKPLVPQEKTQTSTPFNKYSTAPNVVNVGVLQALSVKQNAHHLSQINFTDNNVKSCIMNAPIQGPLLRHQTRASAERVYNKNILTGNVEKCVVNDTAFDVQHHTFQRLGVAEDPSDFKRDEMNIITRFHSNLTKDAAKDLTLPKALLSHRSLTYDPYYAEKIKNPSSPVNLSRKEKRKRRVQGGTADSSNYLGPWAPPVAEEERRATLKQQNEEQEKMYEATVAEQQEMSVSMGIALDPSIPVKSTSTVNETNDALRSTERVTSIFHGSLETNFQGLSWIALPKSFKERDEDQQNYLPKKLLHTYAGHTNGVHAIRFFPKSGHLLLSASMDSQCKIWDVQNKRKCLRTYMGHTMGVRDIQFADEGRKFYSCSFDKLIHLWDTEYGKIIGTFTNDKMAYCVSVHPGKGMDNIFIIGSANKRAVQFDALTGEITQEYNEHLAAVNTVTFCENGLRLATTSDDKKMFIWEFGIPVVVKHITEPHMHSMPAVRMHPSQKFLACQSMDNQIIVYEAAGRYRFQGPRRFRGHSSAGYAIVPGFSNDGRFIMSGDASGKVWFWDWKTTKNHRMLQAHDRVCMGTEWHPTMVSRIATCGWDGVVKLWE